MPGINLVCKKAGYQIQNTQGSKVFWHVRQNVVNKIIYLNSNVLGLLICIESINSW